MTVIVVANPKGGVGKSTLSTNLAGAFAANGEWVALADLDKQQSAHAWLDLRPQGLPAIEAWEIDADAGGIALDLFDLLIEREHQAALVAPGSFGNELESHDAFADP